MRGEMSQAARRLIGLGVTAGSLGVLALVFHPPALPWEQPLRIHMEAASFGDMNKNASVDLGGIKVGEVEAVRMSGGHAVLDLRIDRAYAGRVHADAGATIRPHGLLGPLYIDMDGGSSGRMPDGGTIPLSRVRTSVALDEVLNALQPDVRDNLKTVLVELSKGSAGRGGDVNQALHELSASSADLHRVTETLHARDGDLADFFTYSEQLNRDLQNAPIDRQIADTDSVLASLAAVSGDLGEGIDHTANVLAALDVVMNGNQQNLSYVIDNLAPNMLRLRTAVAAGDRLVVGVNPSLPSLMTAAMETKSAFSYQDANGHFVKVLSVTTDCTLGVPDAGCSVPDGQVGPGGKPGAQPKGQPAPPATSSSTDGQLIQALMGGSTH